MEGTGSSKKEILSSKSKHPGAMMSCPPIQLAAGNHDSITDDVSSVTGNSPSSSIPLAPASEAITKGSSSSPRTHHSKTSSSPRKSRNKKISTKRKENRTKGKTRADSFDDTAIKLGAISVPGSNEDTEGTLNEREEEHLDGEPDAERGLPDRANQEPFVASARLVREDEDDNNPESLPENLEKRILSFVESQLRKNDVVMAEAVTMIPNGSSAPPGSSAPSEEGKICGMSRWTCRMVAVLMVLVVVAGIVAGVVVATKDDDLPAVPSPSMTPQTTFAPFSIFDEIPA